MVNQINLSHYHPSHWSCTGTVALSQWIEARTDAKSVLPPCNSEHVDLVYLGRPRTDRSTLFTITLLPQQYKLIYGRSHSSPRLSSVYLSAASVSSVCGFPGWASSMCVRSEKDSRPSTTNLWSSGSINTSRFTGPVYWLLPSDTRHAAENTCTTRHSCLLASVRESRLGRGTGTSVPPKHGGQVEVTWCKM